MSLSIHHKFRQRRDSYRQYLVIHQESVSNFISLSLHSLLSLSPAVYRFITISCSHSDDTVLLALSFFYAVYSHYPHTQTYIVPSFLFTYSQQQQQLTFPLPNSFLLLFFGALTIREKLIIRVSTGEQSLFKEIQEGKNDNLGNI